MRAQLWIRFFAVVVIVVGVGVALSALRSPPSQATTSSVSSASPFGGNGHNISFDGRLFVVRRGPDAPNGGWFATILRPERVAIGDNGMPDVTQGAFSPFELIQPFEHGENALALCEPNADDTPYRCDADGNRVEGGEFACYDLRTYDSNAYPNQDNSLRRRHVRLWVSNPETADAAVSRWEWVGGLQTLHNSAGQPLKGIEPTVTRDGRLLIWQGHPANDGRIDILMYATRDDPCGVDGWDGPHNLSHMVNDPRVRGRYRLAERPLRAADGEVFQDGEVVRGAYPWLFPEGDALIFAAVVVPCRASEDPPGCGARRGAMSVIGYPTNWAVGHIDGGINPDTDQTVRLFYSSPRPTVFESLPTTPGVDVWPFFGSNTSNYTEVVFDDGLDGQYAGVWLMNESVNKAGQLDRGRTPDTSGYFNTGVLRGDASFPVRNNAPGGKAVVFGAGGGYVEVPHSTSLNPVNGITVELMLRPEGEVDCGDGNNYRYLMGKGDFSVGAWSLVFEEGERFQFRVRAGGEQRSVWTDAGIPVGAWSHVAFTYDATTGQMGAFINGELAGTASHPPATLDGSNDPIRIGAAGDGLPACRAEGHGAFHGAIDEVRVSRTVRDVSAVILPGNHATFVTQQLPGRVAPGQAFSAEFTLRNQGTTTWTPAGQYRLGSQSPQDNGRWGTGRVNLPQAQVRPGEQVTVVADLVAPNEEGAHPMQWRMVQDGVEWFGAFTPVASITVTADAIEPDVGMDTAPPMDTAPEEDTRVPPDTMEPPEDTAVADTAPPEDTATADTAPPPDTTPDDVTASEDTASEDTASEDTVEQDATVPDATEAAEDTATAEADSSAGGDDAATGGDSGDDEPAANKEEATSCACDTGGAAPRGGAPWAAIAVGLLVAVGLGRR